MFILTAVILGMLLIGLVSGVSDLNKKTGDKENLKEMPEKPFYPQKEHKDIPMYEVFPEKPIEGDIPIDESPPVSDDKPIRYFR